MEAYRALGDQVTAQVLAMETDAVAALLADLVALASRGHDHVSGLFLGALLRLTQDPGRPEACAAT